MSLMQHAGRAISILLFVVFATFQGCYSFHGALPDDIKTVAVPIFDDTSGAGIGQYRPLLTKGIIDKIDGQSSLRVTSSRALADAVLEGTIISYSDFPAQLSSVTERAISNRITLVVHVRMLDRVKKSIIFDQKFVGFADYRQNDALGQQAATRFAISQIVDAVFDRAVSGW